MSDMQNGEVIDIEANARLSKRLNVGLVILEYADKGESLYFNKLVKICTERGIACRATVSGSLDSLFDRGHLRSKMVEVNGRWTKHIFLSNEGKKFFTNIYKDLRKEGVI